MYWILGYAEGPCILVPPKKVIYKSKVNERFAHVLVFRILDIWNSRIPNAEIQSLINYCQLNCASIGLRYDEVNI